MIRHTFTPATRSNGHHITFDYQNNHAVLVWGSDHLKPKHRPGNGWRKLTQECIRRLVKQGDPVEYPLKRWAGVAE